MEEPGNGIHPGKLESMNRLLHDIAVDPDEPVANDNPLRQVIVATHSPYFVQIQDESELVLAKNPTARSGVGRMIHPLRCYPMTGTWREQANRQTNGGLRGVGKLDLQSYLLPPENAQLMLPLEITR